MIDLAPEHIEEVRRILRAQLPGRRVCAFGSRVTGHARQFSDLDLAVMSGAPLDWRLIEAAKDAFAESDLPFMVDVLDWASTSPDFRRLIEAELTPVVEEAGKA